MFTIKSAPITVDNRDDAVFVGRHCFDSEFSEGRIEKCFDRFVNEERIYWEPGLNQEVNLLSYFVHYIETQPVGVSGLYSYTNDESRCWLGWFGVHPDFRRKGVGSKILQHILLEAKRLGRTSASLHTDESNLAARRFYERHNFALRSSPTHWGRELVRYEINFE